MNNENLIKVALEQNGLPDYQKNIDKFNALSSKSMMNINNVTADIDRTMSSLKMAADRYRSQPSPAMKQEVRKIKLNVDAKLELLGEGSLHPNPDLLNRYTNMMAQFLSGIM